MTKKTTRNKSSARVRRSEEFKSEALKLAETVGATAAARELGINTNQIYAWRAKQARSDSRSQHEDQLQTEIAKLKRELAQATEEVAILKKATAYFAKNTR
jgi:transposase